VDTTGYQVLQNFRTKNATSAVLKADKFLQHNREPQQEKPASSQCLKQISIGRITSAQNIMQR